MSRTEGGAGVCAGSVLPRHLRCDATARRGLSVRGRRRAGSGLGLSGVFARFIGFDLDPGTLPDLDSPRVSSHLPYWTAASKSLAGNWNVSLNVNSVLNSPMRARATNFPWCDFPHIKVTRRSLICRLCKSRAPTSIESPAEPKRAGI